MFRARRPTGCLVPAMPQRLAQLDGPAPDAAAQAALAPVQRFT
jgi:hypothetical protein